MANSGADPDFPIQIESSYTEQQRERFSEHDQCDSSHSFPTFAALSAEAYSQLGKQEAQEQEAKEQEEKKEQSQSDIEDISFWSRSFPWDSQVVRMNKKLFGNSSFKPLQQQIINATKSNKDVIGLLPTGGGKSLTFQLTAHTEEGVTLIIYPLISLIANQKEILRKKGLLVIDAKDFSQIHLQQILDYNMEERVRLIVTTPEFLSKSQTFLSHLDRLHGAGLLARFVIDEAHCLVQWGNSFREDYLWLGSLRENYPGVPILALSATLSHTLEKQLIQVLRLNNPILFRSDLNRPNIEIKVVEKPKNMLKSVSLTIMDKFKDQSGIIYCSSRNNTQKTAYDLRVTYHINCEAYHAGMNDLERKKVQERWMHGATQVVVATIAFGLGIDKPDVRFVMHICFPKSLQNYIQEIGRCGRDGKPAIAILYYRYSDRQFHNFHIESASKQVVLTVVDNWSLTFSTI